MTARGLRNNNPGNLRHSAAFKWRGEVDRDPQGFCIFDTAHNGLRACAVDVHSKWKRGLNTVRKIIAVYAPPNENDTAAYINAVCAALGAMQDAPLKLDGPGTLAVFVKAICRHENGSVPYDVSAIVAAARDALGLLDHVESA